VKDPRCCQLEGEVVGEQFARLENGERKALCELLMANTMWLLVVYVQHVGATKIPPRRKTRNSASHWLSLRSSFSRRPSLLHSYRTRSHPPGIYIEAEVTMEAKGVGVP